MSKRLTNEIVDDRLGNRPIIRLDNYKDNKTKIRWECIDCSTIWQAIPRSVLNNGRGCPACGGTKLKTDSTYRLEAKSLGYEVLDPYLNNRTKITHKHILCGNIWQVKPNDILSGHGCPNCAKILSAMHLKGVKDKNIIIKGKKVACSLYILKAKNCIKVGISTRTSTRIYDLNKEGFCCILFKEFKLNAWDAVRIEQEIHNKFKRYKSSIKFRGYTELHYKTDLQGILELINQEIN